VLRPTTPDPPVATISATPSGPKIQRPITDFLIRDKSATQPILPANPTSGVPASANSTQPLPKTKRLGTAPGERGFPFCNTTRCRYCPLINTSGKITCHVTQIEHPCMTKVSCRSSNLIYAISCKRCGLQYVGQTLLRLKDRFVHHLRDIDIGTLEKSVCRHFSQADHNGH
jgi:hypothetical protein